MPPGTVKVKEVSADTTKRSRWPRDGCLGAQSYLAMWKEQDEDFQEYASKSSMKFQLGYLILQVLGVAGYQLAGWLMPSECPRIGMIFPCAASIGVRAVTLALGRWWRRMPILPVAAFVLILDMALVSSWRPDIRRIWSFDPDPHAASRAVLTRALNMTVENDFNPILFSPNLTDIVSGQEEPWNPEKNISTFKGLVRNAQAAVHSSQWIKNTAESIEDQVMAKQSSISAFRAVVMVYAYQLLLWYNVIFVCVIRHAIPAVVLGVAASMAVVLAFRPKDSELLKISWAVELTCVLVSSILVLLCKVHVERSQRFLFVSLQQKTKEVISEKVLRCQAEFSEEQTRAILSHFEDEGSCTGESDLEMPEAVAIKIPMRRKRQAPSLHSAPPAVLNFLSSAVADSADARSSLGGDCLPPNALAWVDGAGLPTQVREVKNGQSVLCYDNVAGCLKYTEVTGVRTITGKTRWVKVSLIDGTALTLTADHPIQLRAVDDFGRDRPRGAAVPAADLQPGTSAVTVLRMVPVTVAQVEDAELDAGEIGERVALTVRQPERHSVFVASPADGTGCRMATMAVGSADAHRQRAATSARGYQIRNTFIDVQQDEQQASTRRSKSAPPGLLRFQTEREDKDVSPRLSSRKRQGQSLKASVSDSDLSSGGTPESVGASIEDFLIGPGHFETTAQASTLIGARRSGFKSLGSAGHFSGSCRVCLFENRHQYAGDVPCWKGSLCDRCHEDHGPLTKPKKKSGALRRAIRAATSTASPSQARASPSRQAPLELRNLSMIRETHDLSVDPEE